MVSANLIGWKWEIKPEASGKLDIGLEALRRCCHCHVQGDVILSSSEIFKFVAVVREAYVDAAWW